MLVREFDFDLPADLIAQEPAGERGASRLLYLDRSGDRPAHRTMAELPSLVEGDLLVVNNTRVFPARLIGRRVPSGGAVECLLITRVFTDAGETVASPSEIKNQNGRFSAAGDLTGLAGAPVSESNREIERGH